MKEVTTNIHQVLKKGMKGDLDAIYEIQGLLPDDSWDWPDSDPDSDRFIMLKTVTLDIKVTVE